MRIKLRIMCGPVWVIFWEMLKVIIGKNLKILARLRQP